MITYTDIAATDAEGLHKIDCECFSVPWSEQAFLNESANPLALYMIARDGDNIIGYAGLWKVVDEGQITNIAVLKKYRNLGIASKMLELLIDKAKKDSVSVLSLEVRKSNITAISLYKKYGFKKVGERKNYYHSPVDDAILMDLNIGKDIN